MHAPDDAARPLDDATAVADAVAALGPLDREALLLRVRGRTIQQVATETGTTTAMVRVRLHRAATAVEAQVGTFPVDGSSPATYDDRGIDEVVTDAELGITPMLRARLRAAIAQSRETGRPRFRRAAALLQTVANHLPGLAGLGSVLALAAVGVVSLLASV